jgi:hypothetical protein
MYKPFLACVAAFFLLSPFAGAQEMDHEALHVAHGWARASLGQNPNSVAYVTLHNKSDASDELLSIECAGAARCSLHTHTTRNDISRMEAVSSLAVPAGAHVEFKPGSYHIMMFDVNAPLGAGDETSLTFHFREAGNITVSVPVLSMQEAAKRSHPKKDHQSEHH